MLTVGELFAGIGGIGLGLENTGGFEVKWQVERDEYASKVLAKHWPEVQRFDDVREFPPTDEGNYYVDLIAGGFPCQDISVAGNGEGLKGERSGLFYQIVRIAKRLRPKYLLLENVAALLIRGMGDVLRELAAIGYYAEWHCIPAATVGAPHRRDRVFIVAYANSDREVRDQSEHRPWGGAIPRSKKQAGIVADSQGIGREGFSKKPVSRFKNVSGELMRSSEKFRTIWAVEPELGRVADGVPRRVDRLRCLGNAVVPQVAQFLGEMILRAEQCKDS
jgi:DNA (cytosine-5)-methyltransferase 1